MNDIDIFAIAEQRRLKAAPPSVDIMDEIFGGIKTESAKPADAGFLTNMQVGFAVEPESDIKLLAQRFFPAEDPRKAAGRFGVMNGEIIFVDEKGELRNASDGGGVPRFLGEAGPSIAGGVIGSFGGPVAGAVGSGAGELWRRNLSRLFFGETDRFAAEDIGAGVVEGFIDYGMGKLFTAAGKAIRGASSVPLTDSFDAKNIKAVQDNVFAKTGIRIDAAQASGDAGLQSLRDWAFRQPTHASAIGKALADMQNEQSEVAVRNILEAIAGDVPSSATAKGVIGSSNAAIKAARDIVSLETKPFYQAAVDGAEASGIKVDVSPVLQTLDDLIADSKGPIKKALEGAKTYFKAADGEAWDQSMRGLQGTKIALDALINGQAAEETVDRVTKARLVEVKKLLEKQMEAASPMYRKANEMFARMNRQLVDPLQDGLVGALADLESQGLHAAARQAARIVTDPNVPIDEVVKAKDAILRTKGGRGAWNGVSALWLEGALERAARETQAGDVVNFAGKFRQAVYGSPKQRVLAKTVLAENFQTFSDVMDAFELMAKVPMRGSNTQADQIITRNAGSQAAGTVRLFRNVGSTVLDRMDDRAALSFANDIAQAMSDPQKLAQLKLLRRLPKGAERAALTLGIVTNNAFGLPGGQSTDKQIGVIQ